MALPCPSRTTDEIRQAFLSFFSSIGHQVCPGSPLVPVNDPSVLFTNSGMIQFKKNFLGLEAPFAPCVTTVQRCLRAGGKHNDLDNVGYTERHHTLFEMLGNFSFGAYGKKEAIEYAWTFLTDPNWLGLPAERLWITVYETDEEAFHIWTSVLGTGQDRLVRIGDNAGKAYCSDNFWQMGETGPCGPSSEIFYDYGPRYEGTPPGPQQMGSRFVEIWNLVFMQFFRDPEGKLTPLPSLCVDTGMGLERISAVMQGVHDNYCTDAFMPLIDGAAKEIGVPSEVKNLSLRIIADHARAAAFLLLEGVCPQNQGQGYVLRRIIRRAALHATKLGAKAPCLSALLPILIEQMGTQGADLALQKTRIAESLFREEQAFYATLDRGLRILEQMLERDPAMKELKGEWAFRLYDTYGFPLDLTLMLCHERGISVDQAGFEHQLAQQRHCAQNASQFHCSESLEFGAKFEAISETKFVGYEKLSVETTLLGLIDQKKVEIPRLLSGEQGGVFLSVTPFYPEGGGQVGDEGVLSTDQGQFKVHQTLRMNGKIVHFGEMLSGSFTIGEAVMAKVDEAVRWDVTRHHSAVHLLHTALRELLGDSVQQAGSSITRDRMRLDVVGAKPLTPDDRNWLTFRVNEMIEGAEPVKVDVVDLEEAKKSGAIALFQDKYEAQVRVVSLGSFSAECCSGTHVTNTGQIGPFRIDAEMSIAAGKRRIEASAGRWAVGKMRADQQTLQQAAQLLEASPDLLISKLQSLQAEKEALRTKCRRYSRIIAHQALEALSSDAIMTRIGPIVIAEIPEISEEELRNFPDQLLKKNLKAVVLLWPLPHSQDQFKILLSVAKEAGSGIDAAALGASILKLFPGKGGGNRSFARLTLILDRVQRIRFIEQVKALFGTPVAD